jgi:hypothetical protein
MDIWNVDPAVIRSAAHRKLAAAGWVVEEVGAIFLTSGLWATVRALVHTGDDVYTVREVTVYARELR